MRLSISSPESAGRTLVWDIEHTPHIAETYDIWNTNIRRDAIIEYGHMLCFGAKWLNEDTTLFVGENAHTAEEVAQIARSLLDQADRVISFNGVRFDTKRGNNAFSRYGMAPPSPYAEIDLFKVGKKRFDLAFKDLNTLAEHLGVSGKFDLGGENLRTLSRRCVAGEQDAWAKMHAYNIQDVLATEQVYTELIPWL